MRVRGLLLIAVLVVSGGCAPDTEPPRPRLAWESCVEYGPFSGAVECARLTVPLDYARPDGPQVSLGVLRHHAERPDRRIGSLVVNPGGPGESGMTLAADLVRRPSADPVRDRFDLVGFDARGVGASRPSIDCLPDRAVDAYRALPADATAAAVTVGTELAAGCAHDADFLAHVGTREVARDLDLLRAALGEEKLTYYGRSYATRVGATYATAFPDRIRAMLLDGSVHPSESRFEQVRGQLRSLGDAFAGYAAYCATEPNCPIGVDPAAALPRLDTMLAGAPFPVGDRQLSARDVAYVINSQLYRRDSWPHLSELLSDLKNDNAGAVLALADQIFGRQPDGTYAQGGLDVILAVDCVDSAFPRAFPDDPVAALTDLRHTADDWRLLAIDEQTIVCPHWPVPPTAEPVTRSPRLPTLLVMSTTGDNATPYTNGIAMADMLGAELLTYEGNQHTAYLSDSDCVNKAGDDYLINLRRPPENTRCR